MNPKLVKIVERFEDLFFPKQKPKKDSRTYRTSNVEISLVALIRCERGKRIQHASRQCPGFGNTWIYPSGIHRLIKTFGNSRDDPHNQNTPNQDSLNWKILVEMRNKNISWSPMMERGSTIKALWSGLFSLSSRGFNKTFPSFPFLIFRHDTSPSRFHGHR